jgi:hypothetical protein
MDRPETVAQLLNAFGVTSGKLGACCAFIGVRAISDI